MPSKNKIKQEKYDLFQKRWFKPKKKVLYTAPKSLPKEILQKTFLYILLKLFPKNFFNYKHKFGLFLNKNVTSFLFILYGYYLKIIFPKYIRIPYRHIYALHTLSKFLKILKLKKITFFLNGGTLLGAVRQGSFAGRPSDVDLGIKENDLKKLLDSFSLLKKHDVISIRYFKDLEFKKIPGKAIERIQFLYRFIMIDVAIYKKKVSEKKVVWYTKSERGYNKNIFSFPIEPLSTTTLYDKKFFSPVNPEIYLKKKYGKKWAIPDKKQFFWINKKNLENKSF